MADLVPNEHTKSLAALIKACNKALKHWEGRDCGAAWYSDLRNATSDATESLIGGKNLR